jgi:DNA-binding SARP family transcriptional activator
MEIMHNGVSLPTGSARERFVLATLLLNPGRLVLTDRLVDSLWRTPPSSAKAQLHNLVSKIRARFRGIDAGLIVTRSSGYELRLGAHRLDLVEFRRLVSDGEQRYAAGDHNAAATALRKALELSRGPVLADVPADLAGDIRQALEQELLVAAETKLDADLALGRTGEVLRALTPLLDEHPYREHLYRRQMIALVAAGRRADALAAYQVAYQRLVDDLGVEPGASLRDLERRIMRGEPATEPATRVVVPRQLPPVDTVVTGRDMLLAQITEELDRSGDGRSPVVALVGPGGVGKTVLALAAGHRLELKYPDGQLYADLRGSHTTPADPCAVAGRFLRALGVDGGAVPDDPAERIAMYRSHLAVGRVLVVLDDAADEAQVRPLLPGVPRCGVVVTSRRQLRGLMGATRFTVPVLGPDDGIELLARLGARERVAADPATAARIVKLCGGLPLAVCITAARLALRPDWELTDFHRRLAAERGRLDELAVGDLDARASLALSYRSLPEAVRRLFRLLGLVTAPDWPAWVADLLADGQLDRLTDAHLVEGLGRDRFGQLRYRLHDLVAEYAAELAHVEDAGQRSGTALDNLLRTWSALATEADERIAHRDPATIGLPHQLPEAVRRAVRDTPYEWFEAERASLVDAVELACRLDHAEVAGELALRLAGFLAIRAYDGDRENTLRRAVACLRRHGPSETLARLLNQLFEAAAQRDKHAELPGIAGEALTVARQLGDPVSELRALAQVARSARLNGKFAEARRLLEEAVASARRAAVPGALLATFVESLGVTYLESGDGRRAVPLLEEAVLLAGDEGKGRRTAQVLHSYATALLQVGRYGDAGQAATEGLIITETIGDEVGSAYLEHIMATVHLERREWTEAAVRLDRSLRLHEQYDNREGIAEVLRSLGDLALGEGRPAEALPLFTRSLRLCRQIGSALETARVLCRLELGQAAVGDLAAARACRTEWREILGELGLDESCLRRPRFLD